MRAFLFSRKKVVKLTGSVDLTIEEEEVGEQQSDGA